MTNFDRCLVLLIGEAPGGGHEGGFVNDPRDRGGATNMGVTIGTLAQYRKRPVTVAEVQALTREEARDLYRTLFWAPVRGDELPLPIAYLAFDAAVNCGPGRSAVWLQQAVGAVADGAIGPKTLQRVSYAVAQRGGAAVMAEMLALRTVHHGDAPTWGVHKLGWSRRLAALPFQSMMLMQGEG